MRVPVAVRRVANCYTPSTTTLLPYRLVWWLWSTYSGCIWPNAFDVLLQPMTESIWKILKLGWKAGKLLEFFSSKKSGNPVSGIFVNKTRTVANIFINYNVLLFPASPNKSYKQERGCLAHFVHLATTLLRTKKLHETTTLILACNFAKYSPI